MGCSASRPDAFLSNTHDPAPKPRSLSAPVIHHPPIRKGDSFHLVSLTSSTYGSLSSIDHRPPAVSSSGRYVAGKSYSPNSVINAWELMEGLEDDDDDSDLSNPRHSFDACRNPNSTVYCDSAQKSCDASRNHDSRRFGNDERRIGKRTVDSTSSTNDDLPGSEDKIVIYFTSLRGIRKTYEDCRSVRTSFRMLNVRVDERDVSMDSRYKEELKGALQGKSISLPQVFIGGKHIAGGAEAIKKLEEDGNLSRLIAGFPVLMYSGLVCNSCGDARFVPCCHCNGSRKVFDKKEGQKTKCYYCNENGLVRCPACCS